jgi:hypothetical protein
LRFVQRNISASKVPGNEQTRIISFGYEKQKRITIGVQGIAQIGHSIYQTQSANGQVFARRE